MYKFRDPSKLDSENLVSRATFYLWSNTESVWCKIQIENFALLVSIWRLVKNLQLCRVFFSTLCKRLKCRGLEQNEAHGPRGGLNKCLFGWLNKLSNPNYASRAYHIKPVKNSDFFFGQEITRVVEETTTYTPFAGTLVPNVIVVCKRRAGNASLSTGNFISCRVVHKGFQERSKSSACALVFELPRFFVFSSGFALCTEVENLSRNRVDTFCSGSNKPH